MAHQHIDADRGLREPRLAPYAGPRRLARENPMCPPFPDLPQSRYIIIGPGCIFPPRTELEAGREALRLPLTALTHSPDNGREETPLRPISKFGKRAVLVPPPSQLTRANAPARSLPVFFSVWLDRRSR